MIACRIRPMAAMVSCAVVVLLFSFTQAKAQGPEYPYPRLYTAYPAGAKLGTSVEVTVSGVDLEDVNTLYFSHPGLKAAPVPDPKRAGTFQPNKFTVTVAADAPLGIHDVRAIGKWGVSNPRAFVVGDLTELQENEPNNDVPQAHKVAMNTVVNGVVNSNVDVDYFSFAAKKGQRVVISCVASSIDSRLEPLVQLYDNRGRMLASNRRYQDKDAVVDYSFPADGDYLVRLCEHTYLSGSAEYFYRLTISTGPWIDTAYPPVVEAGKTAAITLYGRNLPGGEADPKARIDGRPFDKAAVQVTAPADPLVRHRLAFSGFIPAASAGLDGFEHRLKNAVAASNPALIAFANAPVVIDGEDNDSPDKAQVIAVPAEICGRIEKRRDRDWYVFSAKQNDAFIIEGFAERFGSPMDLFFVIRQADNKRALGEYDDHPEPPNQFKFYYRTEDPKTRFVAPADGKYEVMISSRTADLQASPRHIYHVSIRKEQPDFRLIVVDSHDANPNACTVHQGGNQYVQVFCFRRDGFASEVVVTAEGLPTGVTCPPQTLGAKMNQMAMVLSATADAPLWAGDIKIKGTATIDGKPIVREARAAAIVWPITPGANIPAISRLSRSVCLAVREKAPLSIETAVRDIALPPGAGMKLKLKVNRPGDAKIPVIVSAVDLPPGFSFNNNQPFTIPPDKNEAEAQLQVRSIADVGNYNLVLRGTSQVPFNKDPKAKEKPNVALVQPLAPIKLAVFNTAATVTLAQPSMTIKAGGQLEIAVKVARQNGYNGEFKVQLVLPKDFTGVSAAEATIPAGANEAKLPLKSPAAAAAATNVALNVRVIAKIDKATLTQDAPLALTITK